MSKTATGTYQIQYAASYPDDDGNAVTLSLNGAIVTAQGTTPRITSVEKIGPNLLAVRTADAAGILVDADCLALIY